LDAWPVHLALPDVDGVDWRALGGVVAGLRDEVTAAWGDCEDAVAVAVRRRAGRGGARLLGDAETTRETVAVVGATLARLSARWGDAHDVAVALCERALGAEGLAEVVRGEEERWEVLRSVQAGFEVALTGWVEDRRGRGQAALAAPAARRAPAGGEELAAEAPAGVDALGVLLQVGRRAVDCHAGGLLQDCAAVALTAAREAQALSVDWPVVWRRVQAASGCGCDETRAAGAGGQAPRCRAGCVFVPQVLDAVVVDLERSQNAPPSD
jgi:hypothetical protein